MSTKDTIDAATDYSTVGVDKAFINLDELERLLRAGSLLGVRAPHDAAEKMLKVFALARKGEAVDRMDAAGLWPDETLGWALDRAELYERTLREIATWTCIGEPDNLCKDSSDPHCPSCLAREALEKAK